MVESDCTCGRCEPFFYVELGDERDDYHRHARVGGVPEGITVGDVRKTFEGPWEIPATFQSCVFGKGDTRHGDDAPIESGDTVYFDYKV